MIFGTAGVRYDCTMDAVLKWFVIGLIVVLLIAFRLAIGGPFGPFAAKHGFLPKKWERWIFDESHDRKTH